MAEYLTTSVDRQDTAVNGMYSGKTSQNGIALLLVLWVLTILMVIVLSFSFMTRTETQASFTYRESIEKRFLAEAGIERGIMELIYRNVNRGQTVVLEGREAWKTDGTPYGGEMGVGRYSVRLFDEAGKININKINDSNAIIMRQLLLNLGVKDEDVNTIVDSILDWRDPDDLVHLHGAESDYYLSLPNPYKAKDADFDTIEELLLVKGVTPELLYGTAERKGIIDFLTVIPQAVEKINVNSASKEVLMAVPGMTPEVVEAIISLRGTREIMQQDIPGLPQESLPYLSFGTAAGQRSTFTIESTGLKNNEKTGYVIKATVSIEGNNKVSYIYYKSPADVTRQEEKNE